MVTWTDLLLPSVIATACVFIASALIHMVIKWHNPDYFKLANEDEVRAALRRGSPGPGEYIVPHCQDQKEMADPAMQKKRTEGPNVVIYVGPTGMPSMGKLLGTQAAYNFVISLLAGYVAKASLAGGATYLEVFQVVGAAALLAYSGQSAADSIWKYKPWRVTFKYVLDGLIYAALTAGSFAWMWPEA
jgi:hypothetical protein